MNSVGLAQRMSLLGIVTSCSRTCRYAPSIGKVEAPVMELVARCVSPYAPPDSSPRVDRGGAAGQQTCRRCRPHPPPQPQPSPSCLFRSRIIAETTSACACSIA